MQSSSEQPLVGGSVRDHSNNGCEGDYSPPSPPVYARPRDVDGPSIAWPTSHLVALQFRPAWQTSTSFPGSSLYLEKVPWLRLVTCACIQIKSAQGVDI